VIPKSVDINGIWNVLPPGIYNATLEEIEQRFATSEKRRTLFEGFRSAALALHTAGCQAIFLDGSFITDKPEPGDFDVCWDPVGVDPTKLDPVFLDFDNRRKRQKDNTVASSFRHPPRPTPRPCFWSFSRRTNTAAKRKE